MNFNIVFGLTLIYLLITLISGSIPGRIPILMFRREHEPEQSQTQLSNEWSCTFQTDNCKLRNQHNMASFQRHSDNRFPMFGQTSLLYLNISNAGLFQAARLESDYFATYSQFDACLSITYLMYGTGPEKLFVVQQDIENKCIWMDNHYHYYDQRSDNWKVAKMTIDLRDGNPRFFIEAHFNVRPPNYGTIAISRISFSYGSCDYDDTNYCQRREEQPIGPAPAPAAV